MGFIYIITNTINEKVYIGQTKKKNIQERWKDHIKNTKDPKQNRPIVDSMRVLGIQNFKIEVLHECENDRLDELEISEIEKHNSLHPHGLNYTRGGQGPRKKSCEELNKKNSEAQKKRFADPAKRKQMSDARADMLNSELGNEWKKSHSEKINNFWNSEEGQKKRKEESEAKIEFLNTPEGAILKQKHSECLILRNKTEEGKKSIQMMRETKKAFYNTDEGKEKMKQITIKRLETIQKKKENQIPKIFKCELCECEFKTSGKLKRHQTTKYHTDNENGILSSEEKERFKKSIQKRLSTLNTLNEHKNIIIYKCNVCNNEYKTALQLKRHSRDTKCCDKLQNIISYINC